MWKPLMSLEMSLRPAPYIIWRYMREITFFFKVLKFCFTVDTLDV